MSHQFRIKILITVIALFEISYSQTMNIHLGEETTSFDIAEVDSISFTDSEPHFQYELVGPNMSILISEALLNDESLVTNDEIGVFNPRGICSGGAVVPETFPEEPMGLAAWGGDQGMDPGFQSGEEMEFRFWDASARREYSAEAEVIEGLELVWVGNGFTRIRLFAGGE